ncbi:MAG: hypothetical protein QOE31_1352 [Solirubrobacteraceae bacterium]|nr:hypothetical protein [Solirubrobacteraceae bacterium]
MLDRALTQRIANAVSRGARPDAPPPPLPGDLVAICTDAQLRVVTYTGLKPATALPVPEAVERSDWIAANVASMGAILDPIADRLTSAGAARGSLAAVLRGPARAATGMLLSAEAGAITGYLSQRVLGQFEFVVTDPSSAPRLLFVAPNISQSAVRLEADAHELLTWIAFHEVTHAVQFTAVPWLRPHLAGLLGELLESLELKVDPAVLLKLPAAEDVRAMVAAVREGGLIAALGGARRRELLDRVQGVMGLIEGHAEHVMDAVGAEALPNLPQLRAAIDRRRTERPPLLALIERLIGLEAKMRQYEDGKRFCDTVVAAAGPDGLHRVFEAPEHLPTLAELHDPDAWMRRLDLHALAT